MTFSKKFQLAFLLTIIIASFTLRFYKLGQVPNGLTVDEADMGYNTYSILETGKDVYGKRLPIFFQSLGEFKPGLPFYTSIPAIAVFGLSDLSIRFLPAMLGSLFPTLIFIFARKSYPRLPAVAYFSFLLFTFAPWNISLSRAMHWYILLIFILVLFLICFLHSVQKNTWFLPIASLFLGLMGYAYQTAFLYVPLISLVIILIYHKFFLEHLKIVFISLTVLLITVLPALVKYSNKEFRGRFNDISVLTPDITLPISISEIEQDKYEGIPFSTLIHNRRMVYLSSAFDNYFDYFNLDYLFVTSKNIRYFYTNNVGLFYLLELPFVLYGLYVLIKRRDKPDLLILALLLIGPIPAALTLGSPFPHRALLTILSLQLISAIGAAAILSKIWSSTSLKLALIAIYTVSIYFFLHQYFVHSPREFTSEFDNGAWFSTVKEAIPLVNQYKDRYDKVVFTWSQGKLVPPIYFLFYNQIDPKTIQAKAAGWTNEPPTYRQIYDRIDNIEFRSINWEQDKTLQNTLLIGYESEFPKDIQPIDRTYLPNGEKHFIFVKSQ